MDTKTSYYGYHIYFSGPYVADGERDLPGVLLLSKSALLKIKSAVDATLKKYDELGYGDREVRLINNRAIDNWKNEERGKGKTKGREKEKNLYLIHNTIQNTLKIGISADPKKRLRTLQLSTGDKLTLIFDIKGAAHMERELHKEFSEIRLSSEWFRYDAKIIERFTQLSWHIT